MKIPTYMATSVLWMYLERSTDYNARFKAFIQNERQRIRALMLLDPSRPDYEQVKELLTAGIKK